MQIDNALIEIRGGHEIPILDGSAKRIFDLLAQVGRVDQGEPRRFFRVLKKVEFRKGPVSITISPSDDFAVSFTLELPHYGQQRWDGIVTPNGFASEITFARTYGLLKQILVPLILGKMRLVPLLRGASLNNAVVIAGRGVLNRHGLRCPDEFVRHRVLDLVGDMMLAGAPLIGKVEAVCTGHIHNRTLLTQLFNTPDAWREEFLE